MERSIYFWSEETILEALEQFIEKRDVCRQQGK